MYPEHFCYQFRHDRCRFVFRSLMEPVPCVQEFGESTVAIKFLAAFHGVGVGLAVVIDPLDSVEAQPVDNESLVAPVVYPLAEVT